MHAIIKVIKAVLPEPVARIVRGRIRALNAAAAARAAALQAAREAVRAAAGLAAAGDRTGAQALLRRTEELLPRHSLVLEQYLKYVPDEDLVPGRDPLVDAAMEQAENGDELVARRLVHRAMKLDSNAPLIQIVTRWAAQPTTRFAPGAIMLLRIYAAVARKDLEEASRATRKAVKTLAADPGALPKLRALLMSTIQVLSKANLCEETLAVGSLLLRGRSASDGLGFEGWAHCCMGAASPLGRIDEAVRYAEMAVGPRVWSIDAIAADAFGEHGPEVASWARGTGDNLLSPPSPPLIGWDLLTLASRLTRQLGPAIRTIEAVRWDIPDLQRYGARDSGEAKEALRVAARLLTLVGVKASEDPRARNALFMALSAAITLGNRGLAEEVQAIVRKADFELPKGSASLAALFFGTPSGETVIRKYVPLAIWSERLAHVSRMTLAPARDVSGELYVATRDFCELASFNYTDPGLEAFKIKDLELLGGVLPLNRDGDLLLEECTPGAKLSAPILASTRAAALTGKAESFREISEPVVVMTDFSVFQTSYYHVLLQHLPRLALLRAGRMTEGRKILVSNDLRKWAKTLILRLGFEEEDLLTITPGEHLRVADALMMSPAAMLRNPQADELQALRSLLAPQADPAKATERLYISRANYSNRMLVNDGEIADEARKLGFRILQPELLSTEEQIDLFSRAKVIAGPSGGGLSNMVLAPRGAHVVSLTPSDRQRTAFLANAHALGHTFSFALGELLLSDIPVHMTTYCPFRVEPAAFRRAVTAV